MKNKKRRLHLKFITILCLALSFSSCEKESILPYNLDRDRIPIIQSREGDEDEEFILSGIIKDENNVVQDSIQVDLLELNSNQLIAYDITNTNGGYSISTLYNTYYFRLINDVNDTTLTEEFTLESDTTMMLVFYY